MMFIMFDSAELITRGGGVMLESGIVKDGVPERASVGLVARSHYLDGRIVVHTVLIIHQSLEPCLAFPLFYCISLSLSLSFFFFLFRCTFFLS
jgi:hypothetical protein